MIRSLRIVLFVLAFLPAMPASSSAQAETDPSATELVLMTDAAAQTGESSSGLPAQAAPPRTLRAHWHVYIAFTATWLLLFGYVVSLGRRFGRLEEEIRQAREV